MQQFRASKLKFSEKKNRNRSHREQEGNRTLMNIPVDAQNKYVSILIKILFPNSVRIFSYFKLHE